MCVCEKNRFSVCWGLFRGRIFHEFYEGEEEESRVWFYFRRGDCGEVTTRHTTPTAESRLFTRKIFFFSFAGFCRKAEARTKGNFSADLSRSDSDFAAVAFIRRTQLAALISLAQHIVSGNYSACLELSSFSQLRFRCEHKKTTSEGETRGASRCLQTSSSLSFIFVMNRYLHCA